jgi:signal transduction histidine kinase
MIPIYLALPIVSMAVATILAAAIVARDPGLRIHRLAGALLAATAWWSFCEVVWQLQDDAEDVLHLVRLSSLGWMTLGPISLAIFAEIAGRPRVLVERALPVSWACAAVGITVYQLTPAVRSAVWTEAWGWGYRLTPVFLLPYAIAVTPPVAVLLLWRRFHPTERVVGGERRISRLMFAAVCVGLAMTLATDVALPLMGRNWLHVGAASITVVASVCAWQLTRYGFSLLSPAAFAREILGTLGDGVVLLYADATVRFANRAIEQLAGVPPGGLAGRPVDDFLPGVLDALDDGSEVAELDLCTGRGERLPVAVTTVRLGADRGSLIVRDLREIRSLRDRVVTGGRLATVGELSASIAREIQAPAERVEAQLRSFRSRWAEAGSALRKVDAHDPLVAMLAEDEELIEESIEGVARVGAIARSVGRFESGDARHEEPADLNAVIEEAVRGAGASLPDGVRIECDLGRLPPIRCVAREIAQVVSNLLSNAAWAAGAGGGHVLVQAGSSATEVWLAVSDDGPGIEPEVRDRMFDPFFTTRPAGEGTGLGLPISFHVVERHGGELRHESTPGQGARFEVRLPRE